MNQANIIKINGHLIKWDSRIGRYVVELRGQIVARRERLREAIELARKDRS